MNCTGKKIYIIKPRAKTAQGLGVTNIIFYNSPDKLIERLHLLDAAKQAGNTGINNDINAILNKLVENGTIDKTIYHKIYINIFLA